MARANRGEKIFQTQEIKNMFLTIIKRARKRYKFSLHNLCIMSTHFHTIIHPSKNENLSKIMQWILSVFAMHYNRHFKISGHVFYDRFKSKIIYNFRQYVATFIYIAENPVKAGMVKHPEDFEFSGINFFKKGLHTIIHPPDFVISLIVSWMRSRLLLK
jgi:REP element-mobilizing transposase RayT